MKTIFLIGVLFSSLSQAAIFKASNHTIELIKQNGLDLTPKCDNCQAQVVLKEMSKEKISGALKQYNDSRVPISNRLCGGLGGAVWIMRDEKNVEVSLCEFKDKSAILSEALAQRYFEIIPQ